MPTHTKTTVLRVLPRVPKQTIQLDSGMSAILWVLNRVRSERGFRLLTLTAYPGNASKIVTNAHTTGPIDIRIWVQRPNVLLNKGSC